MHAINKKIDTKIFNLWFGYKVQIYTVYVASYNSFFYFFQEKKAMTNLILISFQPSSRKHQNHQRKEFFQVVLQEQNDIKEY